MRTHRRVILFLLAMALMLPACAAVQPEETAAPTEVMQVPETVPTEAPTEAPTEPAEPELFTLTDTVFPETDVATGTLKIYIKDQEVYAGGPVSNLLDAGVTSYHDLHQILQPWHISEVIRVRVEMEDVKEKDLPFVFFMAVNAGNEPKKLYECLIYSLTVNTDKGIRFGSGNEDIPFVTGETTLEEITAAYGEPDYNQSRNKSYREIAYYEPFNCAYFSFKGDKVRQIFTYYSANFLGHFAENFTHEFTGSYFGNDCYILLNQYLDVMPYLNPEADANENRGIVAKLSESITMAGEELVFGIRCQEMPELFGAPFWDQAMLVHDKRYVRAGRTNPEEFFFMNFDGQKKYLANNLVLKGVVTRNCNYENWGKKYGDFHQFQYENLTQDSTIDDVLEQYGLPKDIHCTSYARACFAWLFYEDEAGNKLEICVDPILNQITEIQVTKYYEGEIFYP